MAAKQKTYLSATMIWVIEKMLTGNHLVWSGIYSTYRMGGKSLNKLTIEKLIWYGLIEKGEETGMGSYHMKLTAKGKEFPV